MASVTSRVGRDGKARYDVRFRDPNGVQRKRSFARKRDAVDYAASVGTDKLRGAYVDRNAGRETFRTFADRWLAAQMFAPSTRTRVASDLRNHIYPTLGDKPLSAIKPSTVQAWARSLSSLAPNTQHQIFGYVGTILSAAVDDQLVTRNAARTPSVRRPRKDKTRIRPWPRERVPVLAQALPDRYAVVVAIGAGLGLRQGEIFGLAFEDVDFLRREVTVRRQVQLADSQLVFAPPKYGKERTIPLAPHVADALAAHVARIPPLQCTLPWVEPAGRLEAASLICSTREHKPINRNYFNTVWRKALIRIGVTPTRQDGCHALRHLFASVLLDAGESIKVVSEYLGHSDPGFTLRTYTHVMPDTRARSLRAIDAVFATNSAMDVPSDRLA
ncbi:tyrosine-type recombinase/integrase [Lapillicoccus jejuensis]|uniref:Site-specific recombinase XerD n=1 Tax=Lapillicoccus jejuensis TaxID=402171 RepID=A0A542E617_9MICO|nr:site-specific integrase [Lapillicoccus jejuensis]TQJ10719.1 site-specific recombinase XerD [Lapillicoccus jejuensis]